VNSVDFAFQDRGGASPWCSQMPFPATANSRDLLIGRKRRAYSRGMNFNGLIRRTLRLPIRIGRRLRYEYAHFTLHQQMRNLQGVIHVGANDGGERDQYASYGWNVLWIEPIPAVFTTLTTAIASYPNQRALQYLVADRDDQAITLHISNNNGASSSIFDFALHKDIWPSVHFTTDLEMKSYTLDTIIEREHINSAEYNGLVLDTQGSELLVLKGARRLLQTMRMVKVEVADFESYVGCPRPEHIAEFLGPYGFREWRRTPFAEHPSSGRYYDIIYLRTMPAPR
jgi:2-O-methyltransferase